MTNLTYKDNRIMRAILRITYRLAFCLQRFNTGCLRRIESLNRPQKFVSNIYKAEKKDFIKARQRIYHGTIYPSYLEVDVLND